jgi:dTDP-4-dehydrorhamnose 3,5-epimerase
MKISSTILDGVLLIEPDVFGDARGFFSETWQRDKYARQGLDVNFVQDNHSRSSKGVLRGLHYQLEKPQGKLVRVARGSVFDVVVDIRKGSPTFGQWFGTELSEQNFLQLYIPPGYAHGFLTLEDDTDFLYKCTEYYDPGSEHGIAWNDPDIGIIWPGSDFLVSEKDKKNRCLADMEANLPIYQSKL